MAISQQIVDRYVEHRAYLIRFENQVVRDLLAVLQRGEEQAMGAIISGYEKVLLRGAIDEWDGYGIKFRQQSLDRVRRALADVFPEAEKSLRQSLEGVATDVQDEFEAALRSNLPARLVNTLQLSRVPERQLAIMLDSKFGSRLEGSAKLIADGFKKIEADTLARVNAVLIDGVRDGVGMRRMQQMAKKAVGTVDGLMGKDVASYVRTMVQASANDAAAMLHEENADIVRAEQYVATLDTDTCPICGPLDGQVFRMVDGKSDIPRPPRHPNCRCFVIPVLRDWKAMGLPDGLSKDLKRVLDGKPAERTKWSDWVANNPERLRRALGPGRADLITSGQVSLRDLATTREVLSLEKLRGDRERRAA